MATSLQRFSLSNCRCLPACGRWM